MPDTPDGNDVIEAAFVNVPVEDTPLTQLLKQFDAVMVVASIVILLSDVHFLNISE